MFFSLSRISCFCYYHYFFNTFLFLKLSIPTHSRVMSAVYLYVSLSQSDESKANSEYWSKYHLKKRKTDVL